MELEGAIRSVEVLNLVINGWPSILTDLISSSVLTFPVLNLVINGWPSILEEKKWLKKWTGNCFKPCYKWMTFNTKKQVLEDLRVKGSSFKPCYKWMTFNTFAENDNTDKRKKF